MPSRNQLIALLLPSSELARRIPAIWDAGDAVAVLDPSLPDRAIARLLERARPAMLVDHDGEHALPDGLGVAEDVAAVVATSGTTAEPKLAELTRAALEAAAQASDERTGAEPADRWLAPLPLHHVAGLGILVRSRRHGSTPVVLDRFDVASFTSVAEVSMTSLVPTQLVRLLDVGADLSRFKTILLGGMAVPGHLRERARAAGANVVVTYGMTETCGGCVYDGVPLRGVSLRLDGDALEIAGPMLMAGYRNDLEATASVLRDGWFRTGDAASIEDGILRVHGRLDDLIISGGKKIAPADVEDALLALPGIDDAAAFGVSDDEWGERLVAAIVCSGTPDPALRDRLRDALAPAQIPKTVYVVDAIPRNATGKVDRRELARLATTSSVFSARVL